VLKNAHSQNLVCSLEVTLFVLAADLTPSRVDVVMIDCIASDKYAPGHCTNCSGLAVLMGMLLMLWHYVTTSLSLLIMLLCLVIICICNMLYFVLLLSSFMLPILVNTI